MDRYVIVEAFRFGRTQWTVWDLQMDRLCGRWHTRKERAMKVLFAAAVQAA